MKTTEAQTLGIRLLGIYFAVNALSSISFFGHFLYYHNSFDPASDWPTGFMALYWTFMSWLAIKNTKFLQVWLFGYQSNDQNDNAVDWNPHRLSFWISLTALYFFITRLGPILITMQKGEFSSIVLSTYSGQFIFAFITLIFARRHSNPTPPGWSVNNLLSQITHNKQLTNSDPSFLTTHDQPPNTHPCNTLHILIEALIGKVIPCTQRQHSATVSIPRGEPC